MLQVDRPVPLSPISDSARTGAQRATRRDDETTAPSRPRSCLSCSHLTPLHLASPLTHPLEPPLAPPPHTNPTTMPTSTTRFTAPAPASTRPSLARSAKTTALAKICTRTTETAKTKKTIAPAMTEPAQPVQPEETAPKTTTTTAKEEKVEEEEEEEEEDAEKVSAVEEETVVVEETATEAAQVDSMTFPALSAVLAALPVLAPAAPAPAPAPVFITEPAPVFEHDVEMAEPDGSWEAGRLALLASRVALVRKPLITMNETVLVPPAVPAPGIALAGVADRRPPPSATAADLADKIRSTSLPTGWVSRFDSSRNRLYFIDTDSGLSTWEPPTELPTREQSASETPLRVRFLKHLAKRNIRNPVKRALYALEETRSRTMADVDLYCSLHRPPSNKFRARLMQLLSRARLQAGESHIKRVRAILLSAGPTVAAAGLRARRALQDTRRALQARRRLARSQAPPATDELEDEDDYDSLLTIVEHPEE